MFPGGQPHWYDKAYDVEIPQIESMARKIFESSGNEFLPFSTAAFVPESGPSAEESAYLKPFKTLFEGEHTNNIKETGLEALLWANMPPPEQAAAFVMAVLGKTPAGLPQALAESKSLYKPEFAAAGRQRHIDWQAEIVRQDKMQSGSTGRDASDSGE